LTYFLIEVAAPSHFQCTTSLHSVGALIPCTRIEAHKGFSSSLVNPNRERRDRGGRKGSVKKERRNKKSGHLFSACLLWESIWFVWQNVTMKIASIAGLAYCALSYSIISLLHVLMHICHHMLLFFIYARRPASHSMFAIQAFSLGHSPYATCKRDFKANILHCPYLETPW